MVRMACITYGLVWAVPNLLLMVLLLSGVEGQIAQDPQFSESMIESFFNSSTGRLPSSHPHTNNWAVLVPQISRLINKIFFSAL